MARKDDGALLHQQCDDIHNAVWNKAATASWLAFELENFRVGLKNQRDAIREKTQHPSRVLRRTRDDLDLIERRLRIVTIAQKHYAELAKQEKEAERNAPPLQPEAPQQPSPAAAEEPFLDL